MSRPRDPDPWSDLDRPGAGLVLQELQEYRRMGRMTGVLPEVRNVLNIVRERLRRSLIRFARQMHELALRAGQLILPLLVLPTPEPVALALPVPGPAALDRPRGMTPPIRAVLVRAVATAAPPRALPFPAGAAS